MAQDIKYFRHQSIPESEMPADQAKGQPHYREFYEAGRRVKQEKVDAAGKVNEAIETFYSKLFVHSRFTNGGGNLKSRSYDLPEQPSTSIYSKTGVVFDAKGQVTYPISTKPEPSRLTVAERVTAFPGRDFDAALDMASGRDVELYLPRKRELFDIDNESVRKLVKKHDKNVRLVHGPDVDVFTEDFTGIMAWIRGNYGVNTVTVHPAKGCYSAGLEALQSQAEELSGLGLTLAYENLDSEGRWLSTPEEIAGLNLPFTGLTLDISHLDQSTDLMSLEQKVFDKLKVVHLSNASGDNKHLPYRQGVFPTAEFLHALKSDGYKGFIVLEYAPQFQAQLKSDMHKVREIFG